MMASCWTTYPKSRCCADRAITTTCYVGRGAVDETYPVCNSSGPREHYGMQPIGPRVPVFSFKAPTLTTDEPCHGRRLEIMARQHS